MKDRVDILLDITPQYGEILLGVATVVLNNTNELLYNNVALEEIKDYLINEAPKLKTILRVSNSMKFQKIISKHTSSHAIVKIGEGSIPRDEFANIFLLDFFSKSVWPIIVNGYFNKLSKEVDMISITINVKKNVYLSIYGEDSSKIFLQEFKSYLLGNAIIISNITPKPNGDLLLTLLIQVPQYRVQNLPYWGNW